MSCCRLHYQYAVIVDHFFRRTACTDGDSSSRSSGASSNRARREQGLQTRCSARRRARGRGFDVDFWSGFCVR